MWSELKEFILRGNGLDLAIAVVIGSAFSKIVNSLVEDMIIPLIGVIIGGVNLDALHIRVGSSVVSYGKFIQTMFNFLLISIVIFFIVKAFNKYHRNKSGKKLAETHNEVQLLEEIRDILKRNEQMGNDDNKTKSKKQTNEPVIRLKTK